MWHQYRIFFILMLLKISTFLRIHAEIAAEWWHDPTHRNYFNTGQEIPTHLVFPFTDIKELTGSFINKRKTTSAWSDVEARIQIRNTGSCYKPTNVQCVLISFSLSLTSLNQLISPTLSIFVHIMTTLNAAHHCPALTQHKTNKPGYMGEGWDQKWQCVFLFKFEGWQPKVILHLLKDISGGFQSSDTEISRDRKKRTGEILEMKGRTKELRFREQKRNDKRLFPH